MTDLPKYHATEMSNDQVAVTLSELGEILHQYSLEGVIVYIGKHAEHGDVILIHPAADDGLMITPL